MDKFGQHTTAFNLFAISTHSGPYMFLSPDPQAPPYTNITTGIDMSPPSGLGTFGWYKSKVQSFLPYGMFCKNNKMTEKCEINSRLILYLRHTMCLIIGIKTSVCKSIFYRLITVMHLYKMFCFLLLNNLRKNLLSFKTLKCFAYIF